MPAVTEAIQNFLIKREPEHNAPELTRRWTPAMETQVNVSSRGGEPVEEKPNTYTNGQFTWWNIRVPRNASTEPSWSDYELDWPLDLFAEAIGSTGWDWKERVSKWVGFDFDAISGHSSGCGISEATLREIAERVKELPYVEVRKSTSGSGLHLYVLLNRIPTANHTEHAALARSILSRMSSEVGFDFAAQVDQCGGNMWIWHRKMNKENGGLTLIKAAETPFTEIPANWKDHIEVITRKRSKMRVRGLAPSDEAIFDQLTSGYRKIALSAEHHRMINGLAANGYPSEWNPDQGVLSTHTSGLLTVKRELGLKGIFETIATGKEQGDINCFCVPRIDDSWTVYRYGIGTQEAVTWSQSDQGWTFCQFNRLLDLRSAAKIFNGLKGDDGSYSFESTSSARQAATAIGIAFDIPQGVEGREVILKKKSNDLILQLVVEGSDNDKDMRRLGWRKSKNGKLWINVQEVPPTAVPSATSSGNGGSFSPCEYDDQIRHLVTLQLQDAGWAVLDDKRRWLDESKSNASSVLQAWGFRKSDAEAVLGGLVVRPWDLVNLPFQPEFPGDRRWNRDGAKLAFAPASGDRELVHPHWDLIFEHCGEGLDEAVLQDDWCQQNELRSGRDYLMRWAAILFQRPMQSLPYLFLFSEKQNTGKSSLHQALGLMFQDNKGYVEADTCLTSEGGFNRPLAGALLCYVEETSLGDSNSKAYNRIKNWVTGDFLSIHPKGVDPFMMPNATHWIQCANSREACPIFAGDSRIVAIEVPPLTCEEIPWKTHLRPALEKEAPDFLRALLSIDLPEPAGRLYLKVLETEAKRAAMQNSEPRDNAPAGIDRHWLVNEVRRFLADRKLVESQASYVDEAGIWEGSPTMLAENFGLKPTRANQLTRALKEVRPDLRLLGIEMILPEEQLQRMSSTRVVTIGKSWLVGHELLEEPSDDCTLSRSILSCQSVSGAAVVASP